MTDLEIKAAVRRRDGYRCTECGITNEEHLEHHGSSLEVHRVKPGSAYTVEGCVTVCIPCHGPKPRSPRGTGEVLHVRLPADLLEAFDNLRKAEHRTRVMQLALIIEEYLFNYGLWPEKPLRPYSIPVEKSPLAASLLGLPDASDS